MPATQTLPIGDIEGGTTILAFDDVVGKEATCRHITASTIIDGLASLASTLQDLIAPCPMLWGEELGVCFLLDRTGCSEVDLP
jgi:hypothetical protein